MPAIVCDTKHLMTLDAAQHRSGKGSGDENFPVASWLVAPRHRRAILAIAMVSNDTRYVQGALSKLVDFVRMNPAASLEDYQIDLL